ncbi:hypothetical protein CDAR_315591 [Caerostris darwini]|uniref:Secreted protein n=1 Tax=Caerostris darwini TaxID=1538125 RepID=A0AAV4TNT6_9ARAC|nr:hypothetical protein CDAR_315591 [Caerostris darwini]
MRSFLTGVIFFLTSPANGGFSKEPLNVLLRYAIIPPSTLKFTATYFFQPFQKKEVLFKHILCPRGSPRNAPLGQRCEGHKKQSRVPWVNDQGTNGIFGG